MYDHIPAELRALAQWVTAGQDKMPLDPNTGKPASVTDPATWGTFDQAVAYANGHHYGIGFVFTSANPYTFIDLDAPETPQQLARHQKIFEAFHSYTETSRSGKGVHIIVRGKVPMGARKDKVEVYPHGRYAIMTGHVLKAVAITDQQALLDTLYAEMHPTGSGAELIQIDSHVGDAQVLEMASCAANGDKFDRLCRGEWQGMGYPSQSEADFALMSMLAFYTQDNEQCRRLFRMSALGKRDKAQRNDKYLNYALTKIRANEPKPIDLSQFRFKLPQQEAPAAAVVTDGGGGAVSAATEPQQEQAASVPAVPDMALPPGLMGHVATYIYNNAVQPMPEAAIAGAIAMMAGIAGRAFNTNTKTGLNQYVILIAETGAGKEGAAGGIDGLIAAVQPYVPSIHQFRGPAAMASGQAILRTMAKQPVWFGVVGEIGLLLKTLSSPFASSAEVMQRRVLLDLYMKSGKGSMFNGMAYSDSEKNVSSIPSPCMTLLGESSPDVFYGNLEPADMEQGLVPRFLVLEHKGSGSTRNKQAGIIPEAWLVKALADFATQCLLMQNNHSVQSVALAPAGEAVLDEFEALCTTHRRTAGRGAEKELWSRSHLKALRLASLCAVGVDWANPVVDAACATWAVQLVHRGTLELHNRFLSGEVGGGEVQFESEITKAVKRYMEMRPAQRLNAKCPKDCVAHDVVPYAYLRDTLRRRTAFQQSRMGVMRAVDAAIADVCAAGILTEVSPAQRVSLGIRNRCFVVEKESMV